MAVKRFLGTLSTSGTTAGNYAGGVLPTGGDSVIIAADAVRGLQTDTDLTGLGSFEQFLVEEGHQFDVATSSDPLRVAMNASGDEKVRVSHAAGFYLEFAAAYVSPTYIFDGDGYSIVTQIGTSALAEFEILGGAVDLAFNVAGQSHNVYVMPESKIPDVSIASAVSGLDLEVRQSGGKVDVNCQGATYRHIYVVSGGEMSVASGISSIANGSLVLTGGRFNYDAIDATMAEAYLLGGIFDATRTVGAKGLTAGIRGQLVDYRVNADFTTGLNFRLIGE